jgi:plasmid stability protein
MATLNLKNMPDGLYLRLQRRARSQRRSLAQEVTSILADALEAEEPLSILDLRGLGRERWKGVNATRHVSRERRAWD